jgi:hypothetical protein
MKHLVVFFLLFLCSTPLYAHTGNPLLVVGLLGGLLGYLMLYNVPVLIFGISLIKCLCYLKKNRGLGWFIFSWIIAIVFGLSIYISAIIIGWLLIIEPSPLTLIWGLSGTAAIDLICLFDCVLVIWWISLFIRRNKPHLQIGRF